MIYLNDSDFTLYNCDVLEGLAQLEDEIVHCVVTSPPYWGLRDYGAGNQLGLEPTPEAYIERMVEVFREVRRVLRKDGTCWLNIGDSYAANRSYQVSDGKHQAHDFADSNAMNVPPGLKPKDLCMIPARLVLALQADGWYLRSQIVWSKPNAMPESVSDRPTSAYEFVYLLTRSPRYFYDQEAVREPHNHDGRTVTQVVGGNGSLQHRDGERWPNSGRNLRNVWEIPTEPYPEAHFATYPTELVRRCIAAGSRLDDVVLDPFMGSGTTALVARKLGRRCVGIELNPKYAELAAKRTAQLSLLGEDAVSEERVEASPS